MDAAGKLAWFLLIVFSAVRVNSQVIRPYIGALPSRAHGRFSPYPTFPSSQRFGFNPVRLVRPSRQQRRRQPPRSRTTVLQQTVVVNDHSNAPAQNQRSPHRRNRLGSGTRGASSSPGRRTGNTNARGISPARGNGISLGHRSQGHSIGRRPALSGRNPMGALNLNPRLFFPQSPTVFLHIGSGAGGGGGRGTHGGSGHNSGGTGQQHSAGVGGVMGNVPGIGQGLSGVPGTTAGGVGGIGSDLGLNTGAAAGLLAAGIGLGGDLIELNTALNSLTGQSSLTNDIINSLLGQNNQQNILQSASSVGRNTSPIGVSPTTSSNNPQALLGQILGDNRREGLLPGDANEHLIERIKAINPQLLPPDV